VSFGNRSRSSGRSSSVQTRSTISSWVSTEYPNEPLEHRSTTKKDAAKRMPHRPRLLKRPALIRTFELGDKFLRFLHSLSVKQGADRLFSPTSRTEKLSKSLVRLRPTVCPARAFVGCRSISLTLVTIAGNKLRGWAVQQNILTARRC